MIAMKILIAAVIMSIARRTIAWKIKTLALNIALKVITNQVIVKRIPKVISL